MTRVALGCARFILPVVSLLISLFLRETHLWDLMVLWCSSRFTYVNFHK
jgi:hypothetical protein